jgi:hypothetical protein
MSRKYVKVTCISQHYMEYVVAVDDSISDKEVVEWAQDTVTCGEARDFGQTWVGETILDAEIIGEDIVEERFFKYNDYLIGSPIFTKEYILKNAVTDIDKEGNVTTKEE